MCSVRLGLENNSVGWVCFWMISANFWRIIWYKTIYMYIYIYIEAIWWRLWIVYFSYDYIYIHIDKSFILIWYDPLKFDLFLTAHRENIADCCSIEPLAELWLLAVDSPSIQFLSYLHLMTSRRELLKRSTMLLGISWWIFKIWILQSRGFADDLGLLLKLRPVSLRPPLG